MSIFGVLVVKFDRTFSHLQDFNGAVEYFRENPTVLDDDTRQSIKKLLVVMTPLDRSLKGELPRSMEINERSVIKILQQRHSDNWQDFRYMIFDVTKKLEDSKIPLNPGEIECLDCVADALDAECGHLFMELKR